MASLLTCRGKLYFDAMMKRAKNTTKKKGREEDELAFRGTVEPFYSSAHPVTPAVLSSSRCCLRFVSCFHCLRVQITIFVRCVRRALSDALTLSL